MFNQLKLWYLRNFPFDQGKGLISSGTHLPKDKGLFQFTGNDGVRYMLDMSDHVMRQTYMMGMYERNTIRQLQRLSEKDMIFVDVGCNIGAFSLNMAGYVSKVISFEPNPRTLVYLRRNVELNGFKNIEVVPKGLSDVPGEAELFIQSLGSSSFHKHKQIGDSERVQLTTLDEYLASKGDSRVDILKVDVEGHEMACLKGAEKTIDQQDKMVIVLEMDANTFKAGYSKEDYLDFMERKGFKPYAPRAFPFSLKRMTDIPDDYGDNVVFLKGY